MPKTRVDAVRDATALSGLSLFLGFVCLIWSFVAAVVDADGLTPALIAVGLMLGGIAVRMRYLSPDLRDRRGDDPVPPSIPGQRSNSWSSTDGTAEDPFTP